MTVGAMRRVLGAVLLVFALGAADARAAAPTAEHVQVAAHDGTVLDGWVVRPAGSEPRAAVLWTAPYFGECSLNLSWSAPAAPTCTYAKGDNPDLWDRSSASEAVPVNLLLEHGYAVAIFNVRGTGGSGGCFTWLGADEQRDRATLVEWLAEQPWSTGDVGMMGLSYHGTTPIMAAAQQPPHLRTIVVSGIISDPYRYACSPQGATSGSMMYDLFTESFGLSFGVDPQPDRLCPDLVKFMTLGKTGGFTGLRDTAFWEERRFKLDRIHVPVLVAHGLQDTGHRFQEDGVWRAMKNAPKRFFLGQQGHAFPDGADWNDRLLAWLDRHLRGGPRQPFTRTGIAEYADSQGTLHRAKRWPPKSTPKSFPRWPAAFAPSHPWTSSSPASRWPARPTRSSRSSPRPPRTRCLPATRVHFWT